MDDGPKQTPRMLLPQQIIEGLTTKADKIRALDQAGIARADIARLLDISYQHVRNTLVQGPPKVREQTTDLAVLPVRQTAPWPIIRLLEAGFELIGTCKITGEETFQYSDLAPRDAGVYAFAVDGLIKYIGLTRFGLRTRLGHYVYGHKAQKTSAHVKSLILDALRSHCRVEVLIARPPELVWNGLPVDGPAGLETALIRLIKPEWNRQGNK